MGKKNPEESPSGKELNSETRPNAAVFKGATSRSSVDRGRRRRLDNLERAIIKQLLEDGRKPFQAIARELGVDEKTVRNRVAKLREHGLLKLTPTADGDRIKACIVAIIAVHCRNDSRHNADNIAKEIANLPMVSWVGAVMGHYDFLVEVVVDSWEALTRFEFHHLPRIEGIGQTDSFLVLSHYGNRGVPFVDDVLKPIE